MASLRIHRRSKSAASSNGRFEVVGGEHAGELVEGHAAHEIFACGFTVSVRAVKMFS